MRLWNDPDMSEPAERTGWSFPAGSVGHDESVKGYDLEATDGHVGSVSWASYAPAESYLIVSYREHGHEVHHVVPAGAVQRVDHERRVVRLGVTVADLKATPTHETPETPVDWAYVEQFERGMLDGVGLWPYTDV